MERVQNNNNGQQALGQIPAIRVPRPDPTMMRGIAGGTSHFDGVPPIMAQMPNGAERPVEFSILLRDRTVDSLLKAVNYDKTQDRRQCLNPNNDPRLSGLPTGLFTAAPYATACHGLVAPSILYKLCVINPAVLGRVLAQLGR
ncbi:MAG: hypothetical protein LBJ75_01035 [Puniceicoccales bacterium]|jgi:hypothetical protein|nr:hypothetical protein [Puniceicoccales bacterium]